MKQFILPDSYKGEEQLRIRGKPFHHLCNVRRQQVGDSFSAIDTWNKRYSCTIQEIGDDYCILSLRRKAEDKSEGTAISLFHCLPKGRKLDQVVRGCTEAGISEIYPVISDYTIVKFDDERDINKKLRRWERVAREAVKQSGSPHIPKIHRPVALSSLSSIWKSDASHPFFFFHQSPLENISLHRYLEQNPEQIAILIGPEGGLSQSEQKLLLAVGFHPVQLGNNILRTETAALYAIAAVQVIMLEREEWQLRPRKQSRELGESQ